MAGMKKIGFVFKKVATVPFLASFFFVLLVNLLPPKVLYRTMGNSLPGYIFFSSTVLDFLNIYGTLDVIIIVIIIIIKKTTAVPSAAKCKNNLTSS